MKRPPAANAVIHDISTRVSTPSRASRPCDARVVSARASSSLRRRRDPAAAIPTDSSRGRHASIRPDCTLAICGTRGGRSSSALIGCGRCNYHPVRGSAATSPWEKQAREADRSQTGLVDRPRRLLWWGNEEPPSRVRLACPISSTEHTDESTSPARAPYRSGCRSFRAHNNRCRCGEVEDPRQEHCNRQTCAAGYEGPILGR